MWGYYDILFICSIPLILVLLWLLIEESRKRSREQEKRNREQEDRIKRLEERLKEK